MQNSKRITFKKNLVYFKNNISLYLMLLPGITNVILFKYLLIYGISIAFQNYHPAKGVFDSQWVGFLHFKDFIKDPYFFRLMI